MAADPLSHHFLSGKSIFVIGAGLSGSAFVASLKKVWNNDAPFPSITVLDRDPMSTFERRGGYSLSLVGTNPTGGLVALNKMGLLDNVLRRAIVGVGGDGYFKLWTSNWQELAKFRRSPMDGIPTPSIRIGRTQIRQVLLEAAQLDREGAVEWNTRCVSVSKLPTGRLSVQVARGETDETHTMECDMVIAADGAGSKIRSFLRPTDGLEYTGAVLLLGASRFTEPLPEEIGKNWGFVLSRTGVSCFMAPLGEKELQWAVGHFEDKSALEEDGSASRAKAIVERATQLGSHIHEPFPTILSKTDPSTVRWINAHDKLPFRHSDMTDMPVVFIGDSNHAMSPFAGYGANLGLCDAWDLAEQLAKGDSLQKAIAAYDDVSFPRATKAITDARGKLRAGHSTGLRYFLFIFMLNVRRFFGWVSGK